MNFWNTNPLILAITGSIISFFLIENINDKNKENVLGNFFVGVGSLLLIAASQQEALDNRKEQNLADEVSQLKEKLIELEQKHSKP